MIRFGALPLLVLVQVVALAQAPARVAYLVEGVDSFTPWVWCQNPAASGRAEGKAARARSGERAVALSWDFTRAGEEGGCFANFMFSRRLLGQVQEVRVSLCATEREVGVPLTLWVSDVSGEITIQRARIEAAGWQEVVFPLAGVGPGWDSGDRNRVQDMPLSLFGLAVERGGTPTGELILDAVMAVTLATPRQALSITPSTAVSKNLFWEDAPVVQLDVRSYSATPVPAVRCDLRVEDLYSRKDLWSGRVEYPELTGDKTVKVEQTLALPYGVFRLHWALADGDGELLSGTLDVARMVAPCYREAPDCVRDYDRRWSLFGGVFGFITPHLASDMGARWIRYEGTTWENYEVAVTQRPQRVADGGAGGIPTPRPLPPVGEKADGAAAQWSMGALEEGLKVWREAGIEVLILQTLYQRPAFRNPDQIAFAPAYGEAMRRTAAVAGATGTAYELGNEDNGPTKRLYTEVARHGAAGVRCADAQGLIANSGTAFVDLGWLQMQADRGLFEGLDVVCTHPYTVNDAAETWGIYERLGQVDGIIDSLGGMKVQWTTEFGWHHEFEQNKRAQWIPRHYLIGAAAGLERHGLYTWERDYGIFQGTAQPPAASLHTLAKFTEGHRFAGLLRQGEDAWACVWERAGRPVVVAWSPRGDGEVAVPATAEAKAFDLFGNPRPDPVEGPVLRLHLDGAPVYVTGASASVVDSALAAQRVREYARFGRCVESARIAGDSPWRKLAETEPSAEAMASALHLWSTRNGPISAREQAVVAAALRWLEAAALPAAPIPGEWTPKVAHEERSGLRTRLAELVADDVDVPSLRYLLERWDRLAALTRIAEECQNGPLLRGLQWTQGVLAAVARRFARDGERFSFALWPYLYTEAADGALQETLRFVPGEATTVRLRVNSYSRKAREVTVRLRLPDGWTCEPEEVRATLSQRDAVDGREPLVTDVRICCLAAAGSEKPVLTALLTSEGLPTRVVSFDDVVIEAPVQVTLEPLTGLLPATPVQATISTRGAQPLSGLLRLLRKGDTRAVARAQWEGLTRDSAPTAAAGPVAPEARPAARTMAPGLALEMRFRDTVVPLPYHEWPLIAQFLLTDGRRIERPVTVDFACAVRAKTPPAIDGDLHDWRCATPLHLDREEYGKGSFAGKWTPEDCSAVTYLMWDNECLYVAARVRDQTFNQTLNGTSQWMQDSIQLALARDETSPRTELGLALTPKGEEVVSYTAATPAVPGARLTVKLAQGEAVYEAALPWTAIEGCGGPHAIAGSTTLRFSVLVNDDDAVTGRRFLERYGGIAQDKDIRAFGTVTLLGETGEGTQSAEGGALFVEDFEEYPDAGPADAWQAVRHLDPVPAAKVVAGIGRAGSKGLRLANVTGQKPFVYLNLIRPLEGVRPGGRYELTFWRRGRGVMVTEGLVGVCSDIWGNEGFHYADHGDVKDDWRKVVMSFSGPPGGKLNLILRNHVLMEELVLDDVTVREK
jgi:hypothetical protein